MIFDDILNNIYDEQRCPNGHDDVHKIIFSPRGLLVAFSEEECVHYFGYYPDKKFFGIPYEVDRMQRELFKVIVK